MVDAVAVAVMAGPMAAPTNKVESKTAPTVAVKVTACPNVEDGEPAARVVWVAGGWNSTAPTSTVAAALA